MVLSYVGCICHFVIHKKSFSEGRVEQTPNSLEVPALMDSCMLNSEGARASLYHPPKKKKVCFDSVVSLLDGNKTTSVPHLAF